MSFYPPPSVLAAGIGEGVYKTRLPAWNLLLRGAMAGAYVGMGAALMMMVMTGVEPILGAGFTRLIGGSVFPLGVILTILTGAELFTGDAMLVPMAAFRQKTAWGTVIRLWGLVWAGNVAGALFFAALMAFGPLTSTDPSGVVSVTAAGMATVSIAAAKCSAAGTGALFSLLLGSLAAGWLLNLGVLLALCADDVIGKIMGIWFPVMAMSATGLDHAVTNMYLIPAGLLTAGMLTPVQAALIGPDIAGLGWIQMWTSSLIVSSLGNLLGGLIFAGTLSWLSFRSESE